MTIQSCYSLNNDKNNSISMDRLLVSAGLYNYLDNVKNSFDYSLPNVKIIDNDNDFDNGFILEDFETKLTLDFL